MPFAIKKGRFQLSTPAKGTSHVKLLKGGQSTRVCLNVAGRDSRVEVAGAGAGKGRGLT